MENIDITEYLDKLNEYGICIIPKCMTDEMCDNILKDIKQHKHPKLNPDGKDSRNMHFHTLCNDALTFLANQSLLYIARKYTNSNMWMEYSKKEKKDIHRSRCQSGIVSVEEGAISSGGGWHCDSHHKQLKALLYLHDVDEDCGPFAIIRSSRDNDIEPMVENKYRYDEEVLKASSIWKNKSVITGKKGDVIIFDSSNIHRGMKINKGTRYTLTNYYYTENMKG